MKRTLPFLLLVFILSNQLIAQNIGIGTSSPNVNALLEIKANTQGVLLPRTSSTSRLAIPAVKGMLLYDTTTSSFWFNDGVNWIEALNANNGWGIKGNGNTNPAVNFIGTSNNQPLDFRTNNTWVGEWDHSTANYSIGRNALKLNITGGGNTAIGHNAMGASTAGGENTAIGNQSGVNNNTDYMVSIGSYSGNSNSTGTWNTFIGTSSGRNNSTGDNNTMVGLNSGQSSNGSDNTFIGTLSGNTNIIGSDNVALGYNAQTGAAFFNATAIGANSSVTQSNSMSLGGTGGNAVFVGIGTTAPHATLEVNGYTMLGSGAPKLQFKSITGTTPSGANLSIEVAHGLNSLKIRSVSVLVDQGGGYYVPPSHFGGQQNEVYFYSVTPTGIRIELTNTSSNIYSKAVKILIAYEQ